MSTKCDLSTLTVGELVQLFVDTVLLRKTIEHVGRKNRLISQIWDIAAELEARDPKLNCLRGLLRHSDRELRYHAAIRFKDIDRATFKETLIDLAKGKDSVGLDVRIFLTTSFKERSLKTIQTMIRRPSPTPLPLRPPGSHDTNRRRQ